VYVNRNAITRVLCFCLLLSVLSCAGYAESSASAQAPGPAAGWDGRTCIPFEHAGRSGYLVVPEQPAPGKPWLLCAQAPTADAMTRSLLDKGLHIGWFDVEGLYGNAEALGHWDAFYAWATKDQGLAAKPALLGGGEGAFPAFTWALNNPGLVSCLFALEPWLQPPVAPDGDAVLREKILKAHGLPADADAAAFTAAPLLQAARLGQAETPIVLAYAGKGTETQERKDADLFYLGYRRAGAGSFEIIATAAEADAALEGITLHALYFILEHTGQLPPAPQGAAVSAMPEWTVADFAGGTDIHVLDGVLIIECGNEMTGVRWSGEPPAKDYEITLEAMRLSGGDFFCGLTAPYKETVFSLIVGGWGGTCVGISSLDWLDAYNNETAQFRTFRSHVWYPVKLRVAGDRIQAWVDKEQLVDVEVSNRDVDIRWEMEPTKPLGIATWRTTGAIRNFKVTPL